jgi:DNA-binding IclR family transcriptional regulator
MTAICTQTKVGPTPLRAAVIARQLLGLVESGYFERRPHKDEQITARWLTHAIAELDKLRTVREPTPVLDRLDALLIELVGFADSQSEPSTTAQSQLANAN